MIWLLANLAAEKKIMIIRVVVLEDSSTSQLTLFPFVLRLQFYFLCVFALKPVKFGK